MRSVERVEDLKAYKDIDLIGIDLNKMLTTGGRGLWGNSPSNSPLPSPVGSPEKSGSFARFFKDKKSNRDKDRG